jgi:flagellar hook-length control protein FliK
MTLKELMLGNIQSNQSAAVMQLGAQTTQKAGNRNENSAFGEILGSKMNSTDRQGSVKRSGTASASNRKSTDPLTAKDESKPKFLTFREANDFSTKQASSAASSEKTVKANNSTDSKTDGLEEESKKKAAQDNTPNNMIQALAQILGLDMKELQKLLDKAGITSESFNNLKNLGENVSKLSQLLGLDNEQQDTLLKLFEMTGNVIGNIKTDQETEANAAKAQDTMMQGKPADDSGLADRAVEVRTQKLDKTSQNPETDQQSEIEALLAKLNGKIKIRLNELGNELEKDQGSVETSLRQILQPLLDKATGKMQEPAQTANGTSGTEVTEGPELTTAAATDTAASKNDGEGQQTQTKSGKETVSQQPLVTVQEAQPQTVFAVVQPDKTIATEAVGKAAITKAPADTMEIISQVIEKAKVILTPDKSEMIMDLKPDSLGKISLKVATENGMVMAKFVAENQQVKQVLEANMQLLKDSLEKQGLNVQGFSVSVGQDSNRPAADNWKQPDGSKGYNTNGTEYPISGINGSLNGTIEAAGRNNPYTWGSSTINLTA